MKFSCQRELVTSSMFLLSFLVLLAIFDMALSVLVVNSTSLPLREKNTMITDESGLIDIARVGMLTAIKCAAYAMFAVMYRKGRKPKNTGYTSFKQIYKDARVWALASIGLYSQLYINIIIALISNPYHVIGALLGFRNLPDSVFLTMSIAFGIGVYTYHSMLWRYLTDEIKAKYPYLAWPYRKGLMHEENLDLT